MPPNEETAGGRTTPLAHRILNLGLGACCTALLAGLVGLTVVDVFGRYWFSAPVSGAFEMTQLMLAALIFAALPLTTVAGEHIEVDILYEHARGGLKAAMRIFAGTLSALVLFVIAWRLADHAFGLAEDGAVTNALLIPLAPVGWFGSAAAVLSGIVALARALTPDDGEAGR